MGRNSPKNVQPTAFCDQVNRWIKEGGIIDLWKLQMICMGDDVFLHLGHWRSEGTYQRSEGDCGELDSAVNEWCNSTIETSADQALCS